MRIRFQRALLPALLLAAGCAVPQKKAQKEWESGAGGQATAERQRKLPPEVDAYSAALASFKRGKVTVEALLNQGRKAAEALLQTFERMDPSTFDEAKSRMEGFHVSREEGVWAFADSSYFRKLAEERGNAQDKAFFEAFHETYAGGRFPKYVQPQTGYSGCINVGDGHFVRLYGVWSEFRRKNPTAYVDATKEEIGKLVTDLAEGRCYCNERTEVLSEMEAFVKAFPHNRTAKELKALAEGFPPEARFRCRAR
jgi:hypothetical protein